MKGEYGLFLWLIRLCLMVMSLGIGTDEMTV